MLATTGELCKGSSTIRIFCTQYGTHAIEALSVKSAPAVTHTKVALGWKSSTTSIHCKGSVPTTGTCRKLCFIISSMTLMTLCVGGTVIILDCGVMISVTLVVAELLPLTTILVR